MRGPKGRPFCPAEQDTLGRGASPHVQAYGEQLRPRLGGEWPRGAVVADPEPQSSWEPEAATDSEEAEEGEVLPPEAAMGPEVSRDDWEVSSGMRGVAGLSETLDRAGHSMHHLAQRLLETEASWVLVGVQWGPGLQEGICQGERVDSHLLFLAVRDSGMEPMWISSTSTSGWRSCLSAPT